MNLSNDPRARPLLWLTGSAGVVFLSCWVLIYVDMRCIGATDDRVSFVYGAMLPWWLGGMVGGVSAFVTLLRRLHRPKTASDYRLLCLGIALLFISLGPFTSALVRPVLKSLAGNL